MNNHNQEVQDRSLKQSNNNVSETNSPIHKDDERKDKNKSVFISHNTSSQCVTGGGSFGAFISIVVFCKLNIIPSRVFAIDPNPIDATIIPKIVPEIKLIIIKKFTCYIP